jgi:hypothetical protein
MTDHVATRRPSNFPALWSHDQDYAALRLGYPNVQIYTAAATLLIGDAVYLTTTTLLAQKSATDSDYATFLGIVVGGGSFGAGAEVAMDSGLVGTTAALVNEYVYVAGAYSVVYAQSGAAIAAGVRVGISGTSGKIDDNASGNLFATSLEAVAGTGLAIKILILPVVTTAGAGTGTVTGTGTAGTITKFSAAGVIADSDYTTHAAVASGGAAPAGGTGATAGAYDTSANRDALIALVNTMRTALIAVGILS